VHDQSRNLADRVCSQVCIALDHNGEATKDRMARRTTDGTPAIQANFRSLLVHYNGIGFLRVSG
jgi:hypothetical protein